eukprot:5969488-Amphidinium_carterae.1
MTSVSFISFGSGELLGRWWWYNFLGPHKSAAQPDPKTDRALRDSVHASPHLPPTKRVASH